MNPTEVLITEINYDVQIGYAMTGDIDYAIDRGMDHEQLDGIDGPYYYMIVAEGLRLAAVMLGGWNLPDEEFGEICRALGAKVREFKEKLEQQDQSGED